MPFATVVDAANKIPVVPRVAPERSMPWSALPAKGTPLDVAEAPPSFSVTESPVWLPEVELGTVMLEEKSMLAPMNAADWVMAWAEGWEYLKRVPEVNVWLAPETCEKSAIG